MLLKITSILDALSLYFQNDLPLTFVCLQAIRSGEIIIVTWSYPMSASSSLSVQSEHPELHKNCTMITNPSLKINNRSKHFPKTPNFIACDFLLLALLSHLSLFCVYCGLSFHSIIIKYILDSYLLVFYSFSK